MAKIGNFDLTRDKNGESKKSMGIKMIRWTSPERMFEDHRYCSKCEIYRQVISSLINYVYLPL